MNRTKKMFESLESRQLLASDLILGHNFRMPEDTDQSGQVTPIDALQVINALNRSGLSGDTLLDVNADGTLTPLDALTVINLLNVKTIEGNFVRSGVDPASRIARIENAIAEGELSDPLEIEEAKGILGTLRLGGAPELGDCVVDLLARAESGELGDRIEHRLDHLAERLVDLGVDQETIDQLRAYVEEGIELGEESLRDLIQQGMDELGIDIEELIENLHAQNLVDRIEDRLNDLEVDPAVISQLISDMQAAIEAGDPLTFQELRERIEDLGLDVNEILHRFPRLHSIFDPISDEVNDWIDRIQDEVGDVIDRVHDNVGDIIDRVQDEVGDLIDRIVDRRNIPVNVPAIVDQVFNAIATNSPIRPNTVPGLVRDILNIPFPRIFR